MSDIFQEVDEEVRRDQLMKLWERYQNLIVAVVVLVLAAVGGWRGYEYWMAKQSIEAGTAFEAAVMLGRPARLLLAGGGALAVAARLRLKAQYQPDLVLTGLGVFAAASSG